MYDKIWMSIFQQLSPSFKDNIEVAAPIFQDTKTKISLNNRSTNDDNLSIANDIIQVEKSVINSLSSETDFIFRKTSWQTVQDSLEVFVEENPSILWKSKKIDSFLINKSKSNSQIQENLSQVLKTKLPDWVWFLLILVLLTAVWIEPKL
jgi:AAA15 family ATPase/GTPase